MAQSATNPKIEELRFRLKTDPKSRLFYQLAEELRRSGGHVEAEQILRSGLAVYPTYLAAWVSLGRVLRDQKKDDAAVDALSKAMQLDPGNVVAARLLADAYRNLGENVEAIKKYKLVHALMPGDEELKATIDQLDREIIGAAPAVEEAALTPEPAAEAAAPPHDFTPEPAAAAAAAPQDFVPEPVSEAVADPQDVVAEALGEAVANPQDVVPEPVGEAVADPQADAPVEESPFDRTAPPFGDAVETRDGEPMLAAHEESPFEEPASIAAAIEIERPMGVHIDVAPLAAEVPAPVVDEADVFEPAATEAPAESEDLANTLTMADLYARQGLTNEARHIYENILARDPGNHEVREKLASISPRANPKIERLERWLSKVSKREVAGV